MKTKVGRQKVQSVCYYVLRVLKEGSKLVGKVTLINWKQEIEKDKILFEMKEQELMDRTRKICKNNWFTGVEIEEIRR